MAKKKGKAPAKPPAESNGVVSQSACRVRMYRQGFGDCFLLKFIENGKPYFVMIDCGVVAKASDGKLKIQAVLDDAVKETGGVINLLVVTHEHWDHVSAFYHHQNYFIGSPPKLRVERVWVAWTEKPGDALAKQIGEKQKRAGMALNVAAQRLAAIPEAVAPAELARVAGFGAFSGNTNDAMTFACELGVKLGKIDYLEPGELRELPGVSGVRAYVLGPPRSDKLLRITNPRAGEGYADFGASAFLAAILPNADASTAQTDDQEQQPFPLDPTMRLKAAAVSELDPKNKTGSQAIVDAYTAPAESWRTIETDWLRFADTLSLQMNSYTNNTSLVLSLELVESGRVLFFAADAQVGSWMSWWGFEPGQHADGHEPPAGNALRWKLPAGESSTLDKDRDGVVTLEDLFRETVLYKVGHHGSHNGTLGAFGLDHLSRPELVAMMTTNQKDAIASGWADIPDAALLTHLRTATRERLLTSDSRFGATTGLKPPTNSKIAAEDDSAWTTFAACTKAGPNHPLVDGPLYYDFDVTTSK